MKSDNHYSQYYSFVDALTFISRISKFVNDNTQYQFNTSDSLTSHFSSKVITAHIFFSWNYFTIPFLVVTEWLSDGTIYEIVTSTILKNKRVLDYHPNISRFIIELNTISTNPAFGSGFKVNMNMQRIRFVIWP